jgi:hypothetical protein
VRSLGIALRALLGCIIRNFIAIRSISARYSSFCQGLGLRTGNQNVLQWLIRDRIPNCNRRRPHAGCPGRAQHDACHCNSSLRRPHRYFAPAPSASGEECSEVLRKQTFSAKVKDTHAGRLCAVTCLPCIIRFTTLGTEFQSVICSRAIILAGISRSPSLLIGQRVARDIRRRKRRSC